MMGITSTPGSRRSAEPSQTAKKRHAKEKKQSRKATAAKVPEATKTSLAVNGDSEPSEKSSDKPSDPGKPKNKTERLISVAEQRAWNHARALMKHLKDKKAKFLRDEENRYYVRLEGKTILLAEGSPGEPNYELDMLLQTRLLPGTASHEGRMTLRWIQTQAYEQVKDTAIVGRFSALSKDQKRLYVSVSGGKLLQISAAGLKQTANGENEDTIVLEPAKSQSTFQYIPADPKEGLELFEKLIIDTQTVLPTPLAWLAVMQETLFSFVRSKHQDRFIVERRGPSQSGKSSGLRLGYRLLGFDDVKGNWSPAAIRAVGDVGVLALDNKEQRNLTAELQDTLLFFATGGSSGRSNSAGGLRVSSTSRPVVSISTIEGPDKVELRNRIVTIRHVLAVEKMKSFAPDELLRQIDSKRDTILSSLMHVLRRLLQLQAEPESEAESADFSSSPVPDGAARFAGNYRTLEQLLDAYADVAGKERSWAEAIKRVWRKHLSVSWSG